MDPSGVGSENARRRLPRAGGDGPYSGCLLWGSNPAPPRRRGWTRPCDHDGHPAGGSPAQAGMDPPPPPGLTRTRRLPRAGGDGPCPSAPIQVPQRAPPRRRGWTQRRLTRRGSARGSPAQAGMDPRRCGRCEASVRLPRAGGDGPFRWTVVHGLSLAPPRRRGWTEFSPQLGREHDGSPAQAGMDRWRPACARPRPRLPRAGGDGPPISPVTNEPKGAPPRRRGWTLDRGRQPAGADGSPAQAGMDPQRARWRRGASRLPRAGGDGPIEGIDWKKGTAAPPRRRGWTRLLPGGAGRLGGSPAQAGMDPRARKRARKALRLPRAGGDGPGLADHPGRVLSAPPRRRGWTDGLGLRRGDDAGSPAQAGMDPARGTSARDGGGLPRAGGDGPALAATRACESAAPPRRRGWTALRSSSVTALAGSPAQAGMDPRTRYPSPSPARLPRAGGDGPQGGDMVASVLRAPPRRRGWTPLRHVLARDAAGSPAQAGMDPLTRAATTCSSRLPRAGGDGPTATPGATSRTRAPPRRRGWTVASPQQQIQVEGSPAQAGMDRAAGP